MSLVHRRLAQRFCSTAVVVFAASAVGAAPLDKSANSKIEEAIYDDYLATNFDKAEKKLRGIIKACGDRCSKEVIAKAWMYVGIVRTTAGQPGAVEAFNKALSIDPSVTLDPDLASDEARDNWAQTAGATSAPVAAAPPAPTAPPPQASMATSECTPNVSGVQTRQPVPVACPADPDAETATLTFKAFGSDRWQRVKMRRRQGSFQATLPCTATEIAGTVRYYVRTRDGSDEVIDEFGSRRTPMELNVVRETDEPPPAFPGKKAPARCPESVECPPGMPGCGQSCEGGYQTKGWGAQCGESCECESGLSCINGTCETAAACDSDADCGDGECIQGACQGTAGAEDSSDVPRNWLGVQFAADFLWLSGESVCDPSNRDNNFTCFYPGTDDQYQGTPESGEGLGNAIDPGGFAPGTIRVMASYDYLFTPHIGVGARLGFAFRGGPAADGTSFMPLHAEGRATYRFLPDSFFNPYIGIGGGAAQVDAEKQVEVLDNGERLNLNAWKKVGTGFAAFTLGAYLGVSKTFPMQLQLNVDGMYFFPSSGYSLQPSVGLVYGF